MQLAPSARVHPALADGDCFVHTCLHFLHPTLGDASVSSFRELLATHVVRKLTGKDSFVEFEAALSTLGSQSADVLFLADRVQSCPWARAIWHRDSLSLVRAIRDLATLRAFVDSSALHLVCEIFQVTAEVFNMRRVSLLK